MFNLKTLPLYSLFFCYLIAAVISVYISQNYIFYVFTLMGFGILYASIMTFKKNEKFTFNDVDYVFLVTLSILNLIILFLQKELMGVMLMFMYVAIVYYFKVVKISIGELIKFINITFLFYLILSLFSYFGIFLKQSTELNSFAINYGFIKFETLYGVEGSTAFIDSYSATVVLLNMFLGKGKNKQIFIALGFLSLLWTARFTPLVSFVFAVLVYYMVRNKLMALLFLISIFIGFYIFTYLEMFHPYDDTLINGIPNKIILQLATHGRTYIWSEQIKNIQEFFTLKDYIFGNFKHANIFIPWGEGDTSNSHNSFLFLYFRTGIVAIIMIIYIYYKIIKSFDRRIFPIFFGILLSATTNGSIFYVGNPIYLIIIIYLSNFYDKSETEL